MEQKTARLTVLIDPHKKKAFETLCAQHGRLLSDLPWFFGGNARWQKPVAGANEAVVQRPLKAVGLHQPDMSLLGFLALRNARAQCRYG